jgi:hypothetical protein
MVKNQIKRYKDGVETIQKTEAQVGSHAKIT